MRISKLTKAIALTATAVIATQALAATLTTSAGFRTIKDVTVTEGAAVNFGNGVYPTAGGTCSLPATNNTTNATTKVSSAVVTTTGAAVKTYYFATGVAKAAVTGAIASVTTTTKVALSSLGSVATLVNLQVNSNTLVGNCEGNGTTGYFTLSGSNNSTVKITVNSSDPVAFPDYVFTPNAGRYYSRSSLTGTSILGTTNAPGVQAGSSYFPDTTFNATLDSSGGGTLFVGGRVQVVNTLNYDTSYSLSYDVDVTY